MKALPKGLRVVLAVMLVAVLLIPVQAILAFAENSARENAAAEAEAAASAAAAKRLADLSAISGPTTYKVSYYIPDQLVLPAGTAAGDNAEGSMASGSRDGFTQYGESYAVRADTPVYLAGISVEAPAFVRWPEGAMSFAGWFLAPPEADWSISDYEEQLFDFTSEDAVRGDLALYAGFSENYLARYLNADGKVIQMAFLAPGEMLAPFTAADKLNAPQGSELEGWCLDAERTIYAYDEMEIFSNVTLYPQFTSCYYVNFIAIGNTFEPQAVAEGGVAHAPLLDPQFNGQTFAGWTLEEGSLNPYNFTTPVTEDITLYAIWVADMGVVAFYTEEGTDGQLITTAIVESGRFVPLAAFPFGVGDAVSFGKTTYGQLVGWAYRVGINALPFTENVAVTGSLRVFATYDPSGVQQDAAEGAGGTGEAAASPAANPGDVPLPSYLQNIADRVEALPQTLTSVASSLLGIPATPQRLTSGYSPEVVLTDELEYTVRLLHRANGESGFSSVQDGFTFGNTLNAGTYRLEVDWQLLPARRLADGDMLLIPVTFQGSDVTFTSIGNYPFYSSDALYMGYVTLKHANAQGEPLDTSIVSVPGRNYVAVACFQGDQDNNNVRGQFYLEFAFYPTSSTGDGGFSVIVDGDPIDGKAEPPYTLPPGEPGGNQFYTDLSKLADTDSSGGYVYDLLQINEHRNLPFASEDHVVITDQMSDGLMLSQFYTRGGVAGAADTGAVVPVNTAKGIYGNSLSAQNGEPGYLKLYYIDWKKAYQVLYAVQVGRGQSAFADYWYIPNIPTQDFENTFNSGYPTYLRGAVWTLLNCAVGDNPESRAQAEALLGGTGSFGYLNADTTTFGGRFFANYQDVLNFFLTPVPVGDLNGIEQTPDGFNIDIKGPALSGRALIVSYVSAVVEPGLGEYRNRAILGWGDESIVRDISVRPSGGGWATGDRNRVTIRKTDAAGAPLPGSAFNVSLYREGDFDPATNTGTSVTDKSWDLTLNGASASATSGWLGRYIADDYVVITELAAPTGYQPLEDPIILHIDPSQNYHLVSVDPEDDQRIGVSTDGGTIVVTVANERSGPVFISCEVDKDTIKRTSAAYVSLPGKEGFDNVSDEQYRYDIDFRSTSSIPGEEFIVDDPLEASSPENNTLIILDMLVTPAVWGDEDGIFAVYYQTNLGEMSQAATAYERGPAVSPRVAYPLSGWRRWEYFDDSAAPSYVQSGVIPQHTLDPSALGMADGEHITALRFEYGAVKVGFTSKNYDDSSQNREYRNSNGAIDYYNSIITPTAPTVPPNDGRYSPGSTGSTAAQAAPGAAGRSVSPAFTTADDDPVLPVKGESSDWRVDPSSAWYAAEAMGAPGLQPASYLVHATMPMDSVDIVSSATSRIAARGMTDADQDAVLTREIVTFEANPNSPDIGSIVNDDSFLNNIRDWNNPTGSSVRPSGPLASTGDQIAIVLVSLAAAAAALGVFLLLLRKRTDSRRARAQAAAQTASGSGSARAAGNKASSRARRLPLLMLTLLLTASMLAPMGAASFALPGDPANITVEFRYREDQARPNIPATITRNGQTYRLLVTNDPVLESTLPLVRTYSYLVSGALTPEQRAEAEALGVTDFTPVDVTYEREVDKEVYFASLATNDIEDLPDPDTRVFEVTDAVAGTAFRVLRIAGCEYSEQPRDSRGLPTGYTAHVVYRGIETYAEFGYYIAQGTFYYDVVEGELEQYVIVAEYEPATAQPGTAGTQTGGAGATGGTGAATGGTAGGQEGTGTGAGSTTDTQGGTGGGDTQTIGDDETPLSNQPEPTGVYGIIPLACAIAAAILAFIFLFIVIRRRNPQDMLPRQ